jgi:dihydrofolate reductase
MSDVIWHVTMSLDGFIAGPNDAMDWVVKQWSDKGHSFQNMRVEKSVVAEEVIQTTGAILAGRRWYDIANGAVRRSRGHIRRRVERAGVRPHT